MVLVSESEQVPKGGIFSFLWVFRHHHATLAMLHNPTTSIENFSKSSRLLGTRSPSATFAPAMSPREFGITQRPHADSNLDLPWRTILNLCSLSLAICFFVMGSFCAPLAQDSISFLSDLSKHSVNQLMGVAMVQRDYGHWESTPVRIRVLLGFIRIAFSDSKDRPCFSRGQAISDIAIVSEKMRRTWKLN